MSDHGSFAPTKIVLPSAVGVVGSVPLTLWLMGGASDHSIGAMGLALSVAGLVLSVTGFAITIWQLIRTRSATQAVSQAIQRLRRDFGSLDVLTELRSAAEAAEEAQGHLLEKRWPPALVSYNKIRHSLYKAVAVENALNEADREAVKDFIAHALGACAELENAAPDSTIDTSTMSAKLRELEGFLVSLEYRTKDTFGE